VSGAKSFYSSLVFFVNEEEKNTPTRNDGKNT
jgi:hypothetical protein